MVAVVAGNGLGLFNTSVNVLGNAGVLGQGVLGQSRASAYVNAVTGNLILQSLDEEISGRGSDLPQLLTYNSKGTLNGGAGQGWSFGGQKTLALTATVNSAGSFVDRTESDGHVTRFTWDIASRTYLDNTNTQLADGTPSLAHEGGGPDDTLTWDGSQWLFVDGATQRREIYLGTGSGANVARLHSQTDTSGNVISYDYDANGRLSEIIDNTKVDGTGTGSGQKLVLTYGTGPGGTPRVPVPSFLLSQDGSARATPSLRDPRPQVT